MHTSDDDGEVVVVVFAAAVVVVVVVRKIVGVGVGVVGVGHLIIRTKTSLSSSLIVVVVVVVVAGGGGSGGREGGRKVGEDGRGEKKIKWSVRPRFLPRFLFYSSSLCLYYFSDFLIFIYCVYMHFERSFFLLPNLIQIRRE